MRDDALYKIHIAECIIKIKQFTADIDEKQFRSSPLIHDAVLRNLQVLSESTQRLSNDFKKTHPQIEWHKIAGLRNILTHDYLGIDLHTVWLIVTMELDTLKLVVTE